MPPVRPFRAIVYAPDRFAQPTIAERIRLPDEPGPTAADGRLVTDLTDLACPPYDVISPEQQAALLARHPRNAVRLELPPEPDPYGSGRQHTRRLAGRWHARAARGGIGLLLRPWLDGRSRTTRRSRAYWLACSWSRSAPASARTSTPCPARRPIGWPTCAQAGPRCRRSWRPTSTGASATAA